MLVCNVGKYILVIIEEIDEIMLDSIISLNIKGVYGVIKVSLFVMKKYKEGVIVVMGLD